MSWISRLLKAACSSAPQSIGAQRQRPAEHSNSHQTMTDEYERPAFVFLTEPEAGTVLLNISATDGEITRFRLSDEQVKRLARESVPIALSRR